MSLPTSRMAGRRERWAAGVTAAAALLASCGGEPPPGQELSVYAASSLTEAFREIAEAFEAVHAGTEVSLTFAGSQVLRLQIEQGAPADVFASANVDHVEALVEAGLVTESRTFAHNELVVIVPLDNPAGIEAFADLPRAERLVIGTANVPVGAYTREALRRAAAAFGPDFETAVLARVVSEESNVRLTRAKVELGEADAAVVYRTDAASSDQVRTITIPPDVNVRADYAIGVVQGGAMALAERWIAFVLSSEGRAALSRHGFLVE